MAEFKVGDLVTWTSQAGGSTKTKVGTVIAVEDSKKLWPNEDKLQRVTGFSNPIRRSDYWGPVVVMCRPMGSRGPLKPRIYSPRVENLSHAPEGTPHECPR